MAERDYKRACEALAEVYTAPYAVFRSHLQKIERAAYSGVGDSKALLEMVAQVTSSWSQLRTLENVDLFEFWCVVKIENEFDERTREAWRREVKPDVLPDIQDIKNFAINRAKKWDEDMAVKRAAKVARGTPEQPRGKGDRSFVETRTGQWSRKLMCYYCKGEHLIVKCTEFHSLAISKRKEAAEAGGKCEGCYRRHEGNCGPCKECGGPHMVFMCDIKEARTKCHCLGWGKEWVTVVPTATIRLMVDGIVTSQPCSLLDTGAH